MKIGQKLLDSFNGFQGLVTTHTDRQHIHNHLVLSSVNFETGLKWQQSKKDLQALKYLSDQLCRNYGLSVIEKGKGWKSYGENHANTKGGSWKRNLVEVVADAIGKSNTREEILHCLNAKGIEADFQADKVLFVLPDGKKCGSDKLLTYGDFTKENLMNTIQYNELTFTDALNNTALMYEAVKLASQMLGHEDKSDLQDKFLHGKSLSALECDALKHAIHEMKKGGRYEPNNSHSESSKPSSQPYLLMSITTALELVLEEKGREKQYEEPQYNDIDEEDLEL